MKKLVPAIALSIFVSASAHASAFCEGFRQGYVTGYRQASGFNHTPYTPYCPFKPFRSFNDPESDLEYGYIIGYEQGLSEGRF